MRFFCTGHVVEWNTPDFAPLLAKMGKSNVDGARAVILLDVWKVCVLLFFHGASFFFFRWVFALDFKKQCVHSK